MNRLVDRWGRRHTYLRISITDRCNLRCVYCMPAEGNDLKPKDELLSFEEIYRVAKVFVDMGIDKIRLTGGEPLVRKDIEVLVRHLRSLPIRTLAMTTNAVLLKQKARILKDAGMDALNISLDTLQRDRFIELARRDDFDNVMDGINESIAVGFSSLKLNVVVMSGRNDDEILDFIDFVRDRRINVRFIEYMPFKDNQWNAASVFGYKQMREQIETRYRLHQLPVDEGAVAKDFAIEGYPATVSFISSMTDSFCSTCNRLRLTADGNIKSCLFSAAEVNVRDIIRGGASDLGLESAIQSAVLLKPAEHPPMEELAAMENRSMVDIGG
jgi:molybdenum cofactor biosynthesis protein A